MRINVLIDHLHDILSVHTARFEELPLRIGRQFGSSKFLAGDHAEVRIPPAPFFPGFVSAHLLRRFNDDGLIAFENEGSPATLAEYAQANSALNVLHLSR
jgi:hypothetical protein